MKKLIIHGCIVVSVLGSIGYATDVAKYVETFWDYVLLERIETTIDETQKSFDEEELVYQLGLITKYEERMQDDIQAAHILSQSRKMVLRALATIDSEKQQIFEELEEDTQSVDENVQDPVSSIPKPVLRTSPTVVSSISAETIARSLPSSSVDEVTQEDEEEKISPLSYALDAGIAPPQEVEIQETLPQSSGTPDADSSFTPSQLYETYADTVNGEISNLCTIYYDQIDQIAKRNDFPTSLIIAIWYREHSCIFANPDNGWGNFQITSHYYEPGTITRDEFATQIQNFIDFSHAKRKYYDSIQRFGPKPVTLSYTSMDVNSIRKHAILYNGVYPDVTLESSWYSNENFTQFRGGRDGIVATVLKVIKWVEGK